MYLHEPPRPERFEPKTPRERRQAWKEGRLGFNEPNPTEGIHQKTCQTFESAKEEAT